MTDPDAEMDTSRIPTNLRTLLILEIVGKSDHALTATEINAGLGLPKQTVHRLCATLEKEGFLTREGANRRYRAAPRLRDLAVGLLHSAQGSAARRQILMDVARQVGETVNFVIPNDGGMHYLDRVETDWAFRIQLPIGTDVPFHCTASGKCYLASLSRKSRETLVSSLTLEPLTEQTHITASSLLTELDQIADQGYALDCEEFIAGMVAIAVPVTDQKGRFLAAVAFHGPTQRMSVASAVERKSVLLTAAKRLRDVVFDGN
ncbi:MAG: IclR family transcriptional regulator [Pseudomonadota bacterium]